MDEHDWVEEAEKGSIGFLAAIGVVAGVSILGMLAVALAVLHSITHPHV